MMWIFLVVLVATIALSVIAWRRTRAPSFKQISDALERDIAAAEARGVHVDRTERIVPARRRIKF